MEWIASTILALIGIYVLITRRRNRPEGSLKQWGVHFTPNTVHTANDLERAISAFVDSWITAFPHQERQLKRSLRKLDIIWHSKRIVHEDRSVLALMESPQRIHLWIGPKLKDGKRHLAYTGLFDQLGKLALTIQEIEPDTSKSEIRKILADAREKLF